MDIGLIEAVEDCIAAVSQLKSPVALAFMADASEMIANCFQSGNKVLVAGNGGSLCDAMHFAEELTGFYREKRPALPAIALTDPGHITCCANDLGFEYIFSRGVEAYGKPGDIFIGLTTSGNSPNILNAFETAKRMGLFTIAFLGKKGGRAKGCADLEIVTSGDETSRIQEVHMTMMHIIIELIESKVFTKTLL